MPLCESDLETFASLRGPPGRFVGVWLFQIRNERAIFPGDHTKLTFSACKALASASAAARLVIGKRPCSGLMRAPTS
ncbi:MAG TPA: hypothetical protein VMT91_13845, partial [Anaerolineales bacterium]|nr:hypothetical protein [Anaerolineales bacterium]